MTFSGVLSREYEWAVQKESVYGTSPGSLAGTNFFKHRVMGFPKRVVEKIDRDMEANNAQGDVQTLMVGRQTGDATIEVDLIPNGNTSTPTAPDCDLLYQGLFGSSHVATAHTTTGAGSSGTTLNLTAGGGAASGLQQGDLFACNQDSAGNYEVRQVVSISTDAVTIDRAFTTNSPASGQAVKVGTTYLLTFSPVVSLFLWNFNYNNLRYQIPGCVVDSWDLTVKGSDKTPLGLQKFMLKGQRRIAQSSTSRPTPSTNGVQLVPIPAKLWIGAVKYSFVDLTLSIKSGLALRNNESGQLYPDAATRTAAKGYWNVELGITPLVTDTWQTISDNASTYTTQDAMVQFGNTPGQIVGFRAQNWRPIGDEMDVGGEVAYGFKGRCLGSASAPLNSLYLAYI